MTGHPDDRLREAVGQSGLAADSDLADPSTVRTIEHAITQLESAAKQIQLERIKRDGDEERARVILQIEPQRSAQVTIEGWVLRPDHDRAVR